MALDEWDWIAHPDGLLTGDRPLARKLVDRREDIIVYGEVNDAEANYSYDDFALISLDGEFYLLNTSGCSCPSPRETWGVVEGPCSLDEMAEIFAAYPGDPKGYGVTKRQADEFMALIDVARKSGDVHGGIA